MADKQQRVKRMMRRNHGYDINKCISGRILGSEELGGSPLYFP